MQRQRSAVLAALLAGTAVCSVPRPRVAVWRPPPSRGVHHDPYGYGGAPPSVSLLDYPRTPVHRRPPAPTNSPFHFKFDVDLVTVINYLLLPLLPLLLSLGSRVTATAAALSAPSGGGGSGGDQVLDYDTGETVSSVNTNTESVSENGSQVITESVNNSPVTTETNEETNDDNDVITNP
ncbi:hypothetical protein FJT64_011921 [Amphibalanus amphitrite]|uniref:Uncharacterized protein n=1 Tax=Amphibalanus amphitrite TaxID=1232801 RepID=A0A6A4V816_AMPAM|nr:hypothetical protein FJT64_011921 [Amphibalanus amphitrite]